MKKCFAIVVLSVLLIAGCNKQEGKQALPPVGHSGMEKSMAQDVTQKERTLIISDETKASWQAVTLFIEDRKAKKTAEETISIGSAYKVPDTDITINVLAFLPDFKMDDERIFTATNKPNNPAVQVLIQEPGKQDWKGWLYAKHPDVHAFTHEKIGMLLVAGVPR